MKDKKEKVKKKSKHIGIRAKLIGVIIPIVLVIMISFFGLARKEIVRLSKDKLLSEAKVSAADIYAWIDRVLGELQIYKDTIEDAGFQDDAEILKYMETTFDKNPAYPSGVYMGDDSGVYMDASGWTPDDDWVLTERDWYMDGKDNEELVLGEPYYDSQTGDVCVSASVRMRYPDAVRVLAADIYLYHVSDIVSEINKEGKIQSYLITKESKTIIAHPNMELVALKLDEDGMDKLYGNVSDAITKGKTGIFDVDSDEDICFACMNDIPNTDWILVSYMSKGDVLADLTNLEIIMAVIAVAAALVLILVTLSLMNRVVKPVANITGVIQKISEGDFSQNIEVKGHDEIAVMSTQMQEFLVHMRKTISDIMETARWLEKQSVENDRVSDSLMDSSVNQSEAMKTLNSKVEMLSKAAGQVAAQMEQLAGVVKKADTQGEYAGGMMQQTFEISEKGREAAERVSEGMSHIEKSISSLSEQIMQTDAAIEQISSMVGMIVNVAEETNLLSLNASIEAARAGDAGRGFAVVADQIGTLAVSSGTAADDISNLTEEIRSAMHHAIERMNDSIDEVKSSKILVEKNREAFELVFEKAGEANRAVEQMAELVEKAENTASDMHKVAESQVVEAGQITESARELADYTEIVGEDSNMVARNAKELEQESKRLIERMGSFRI